MKVFGLTNIGRLRARNQDAYYISTEKSLYLDNLYIVADGMGGHMAGEVASATAVEAFNHYIKKELSVRDNTLGLLQDAAKSANERVFFDSMSHEEYHGMGTTLTVLTIRGRKGYCVHIGDSRIYRIRQGEIELITKDHSFVYELMSQGRITREEAKVHPKRHILTRALGPDPDPEIDNISFDVQTGDKILMCTDGLTTMIDDIGILKIIEENAIENVTEALIHQANENGGLDNITAIIIEVEV